MTIMSDRRIRAMCEQPIAHVRFSKYNHFGVLAECKRPIYGDATTDIEKEAQRMTGIDIAHIDVRPVCHPNPNFKPMIWPFVAGQVREVEVPFGEFERRAHTNLCFNQPSRPKELPKKKVISFGTSSFGYDVRLQRTFKIFTNINSTVIDPLNFDEEKNLVDHEGDFCIIPPHSYILGVTMEKFIIPRNVNVLCVGKSTYARCGAIVNVTPIEAGFEGTVVIEISNSAPSPLKVYAGMGIAQFQFFEADEDCEVSYADRGGKYQHQEGVTTARL